MPAGGRSPPRRKKAALPPDSRVVELRIPADVAKVIHKLSDGGHEAYVVGGCVRDAIRGVDPADWDVATDARPEEIQQIFRRSLYLNRFGTVVVRMDVQEIEVTTYRVESEYSDRKNKMSDLILLHSLR